MFVQDIRGFKNKTASPQEKPMNDPKHFISDSIFKRFKFDFSSSEGNIGKNYFLGDCIFLGIRLTYVN